MGAKAKSVKYYLEYNNAGYNDLRDLTSTKDLTNILNYVLNSTKYIIEDIEKYDKPPYDYLANLKQTVNDLLNIDQQIKYNILFRDIARIRYEVNNLSDLVSKEILETVNEIELLIIKKMKNKMEEYDLFMYLVNDVKNIDIIKEIIQTNPKYLNLKDTYNRSIFIDLFFLLLSSTNKNEVTYYDEIISLFLINPKFSLQKDEQFIVCTAAKKKLINSYDDDRTQVLKKVLDYLGYDDYNVFIQNEKSIIKRNSKLEEPLIVTIDSNLTKYRDDGFCISKIDCGYLIKIYTADSGAKINSNLGTNHNSKNLLSLNSNGYKNVIEYTIVVDYEGNIIEWCIVPTKKLIGLNLTCQQANNIINRGNKESIITQELRYANEIATILHEKSKKKAEYRKLEDIKLKLQNQPLLKSKYENRSHSEIITEEFMVMANKLSPLDFLKKGYPFIYRVLPAIDIVEYISILEEARKLIKKGKVDNIYLKQIEELIKMTPQPYYSKRNIGHAGLDTEAYSHSTVPIGRDVDHHVQLLMHDLLFTEPTDEKFIYWDSKIDELCKSHNDPKTVGVESQQNYENIKQLIKNI